MDLLRTAFVLASVPLCLVGLSAVLMFFSFRGDWLTLRLMASVAVLVILATIVWIGYIVNFSLNLTVLLALGLVFVEVGIFLFGSRLFPNVWRKMEVPF